MSKKQTNKFRRRKRVIPAVITVVAFAMTVAVPASALTPSASASSQTKQATTSSSASSSASTSQTSSETNSGVSSSAASSGRVSSSNSAVSQPSSERQTQSQTGSVSEKTFKISANTTYPRLSDDVDILDLIGNIDTPVNGATVSGTINVAGWALGLSTSGSEIGVSLESVNDTSNQTTITSAAFEKSDNFIVRNDVANHYPQYNNAKCGFNMSVNTTKYENGQYFLNVFYVDFSDVDSNGDAPIWPITSALITVSNAPQSLTDIDVPADGSSINGTVNVSGWVLNVSGINRVDVYAWDSNGQPHSLGSVASKDLIDRTDVANAFASGGYGNIDNSGYSLPVDMTKLAGGTYTLAVAGIGNNGVVQWATKTINVTTPQPLTDIDAPADGSSVNGTMNVSGWVLNVSGINRVDVYAWDSNGQPHSLGSVASKDLTGRSDVAGAFANDGYANIDNTGYSLPVDTTQLAGGTYTLAVAGIGNNGVVQWATKTINVTTPQPLTDIDVPADGSSVNGTVNVSGWALNVSGINRVDVYAWDSNGKPHSLGSVASKDLTGRSDVAGAFANDGYANIATSGYSLPVDTTKLDSGTYTLAVAGIGNNGVVQWATKIIKVQ